MLFAILAQIKLNYTDIFSMEKLFLIGVKSITFYYYFTTLPQDESIYPPANVWFKLQSKHSQSCSNPNSRISALKTSIS